MSDTPFYIDPEDPPAKQRIMEEGLRLFAKKGLSSTSIRDIAAASGYSNPALYKHFATKQDLAVELFERCYREQMARLLRALEGDDGFEAQFSRYLTAFAKLYDAHPHAIMFTTDNLAVLWPHVSPALRERTLLTLTRELLMEGRRQGFVTRDADLSLQIALITGLLAQVTRQLYLGAMKGTASSLVAKSSRILRAGLL